MSGRVRSLLPVIPLLVVAACGTQDSARKAEPTAPLAAAGRHTDLSQADADQRIRALIAALWPNGLQTSVTARWTTITRSLARTGDATQQALARQKLTELIAWTQQHQSRITPPPGESQAGALARLVLSMSAYVYGQPVPDLAPGIDATFAIVNPGSSPPPIVTPTGFAGVALPANAVNQPTIIVVSQNTASYPLCGGPLQTAQCQLPRFYRFDQFPHVPLNSVATFAVCHLRPAGLPWDTDPKFDDGLRLAHTLPADPADYTPNATQIDGIEILSLTAPVSFIHCAATPPSPGPTAGGLRTLRGLLASAWSLVTPRTAWAIDLGGGGGRSRAFSDFEVVDPRSTITFSNINMSACNTITFGYTVDGVATDVATKPYDCNTTYAFDAVSVRVPATTTVQVYLRDNTCAASIPSRNIFTQAGTHASIAGTNPYQIAITDAGADCQFPSTVSRLPIDGAANLTVTETVGNH